MANSADPDQMASLQKPTDLDLHCLQRQGISEFSRTRVKIGALRVISSWQIKQTPYLKFCFELLKNSKEMKQMKIYEKHTGSMVAGIAMALDT